MRFSSRVDFVPRRTAPGFEMDETLLWNLHGVATARVAPNPWCAVYNREITKISDFDSLFARHGVSHRIKDGFDSHLSIDFRQVTKPGCNKFNKS